MVEISKLKILDLKKIKKEIDKPYEESLKTTIIENKGKVKGKEFTQYRVSIPKKLAELIKLNKNDFQAEAVLDKKEESITIKIQRK